MLGSSRGRCQVTAHLHLPAPRGAGAADAGPHPRGSQRRFTDSGYAATTVESIAKEAGVAVDTVYASFGTKRDLLAQLAYFRAAGDDAPVAVIDRAGPQAARRETDQRRQIAMFGA